MVRISSVLAPRPTTPEVILSLFTELTNNALSAYSEPDPIPGVLGNQMNKTDKPHALSKLNFLVEEMDNKHVNILNKFRYPYRAGEEIKWMQERGVGGGPLWSGWSEKTSEEVTK